MDLENENLKIKTPKINPEKKREYNEKYYLKHKNYWKDINKKKEECPICGGFYSLNNKSNHLKGKKCQKKKLEQLQE